MTNAGDIYGSKYLDIEFAKSRKMMGGRFKIEAEYTENFEKLDKKWERIVLRLAGVDKPMIVSVQAGRKFIQVWGPDSGLWVGKEFVLSSTVVNGKEILDATPLA